MRFLFSLSKVIFTTIKMPLARTNGVSTIVALARTWHNQHPWPARCATYWSVAHAERKIQAWKGLVAARGTWEGEDHLLFGRLVCRRCDDGVQQWQWSLISKWWWWGGVVGGHELIWGHILSHVWSTFWCGELVRARQNGGEIGHFRRAETASFHRPNRCAPKISKTILRLKVRKMRKNCTQQLHNADLGLSMWPLAQLGRLS